VDVAFFDDLGNYAGGVSVLANGTAARAVVMAGCCIFEFGSLESDLPGLPDPGAKKYT